MDRFGIEITEPAENDLYEIGNYISKELLEPDAARRKVEKIGQAILSLEEMPLRNGLVADEKFALLGIRKILIDNYVAFYIADESRKIVTILRILCIRRNWISMI